MIVKKIVSSYVSVEPIWIFLLIGYNISYHYSTLCFKSIHFGGVEGLCILKIEFVLEELDLSILVAHGTYVPGMC